MTNAYRKDFPLLMAQDIAYLDNAATASRTPTPCGACTP